MSNKLSAKSNRHILCQNFLLVLPVACKFFHLSPLLFPSIVATLLCAYALCLFPFLYQLWISHPSLSYPFPCILDFFLNPRLPSPGNTLCKFVPIILATCYRDANQYDFIIFSTIKRGKYDNTVSPLENTTFHQKPTNQSKTKQKNAPKSDRTCVMA